MNSPASSSQRLPRGVRFAAAVCLVLSSLTGLFALSEALGLGHLSELKESSEPRITLMADKAVTERAFEAQFAALEPMREPRSLVLGALSVACALVFVSAGRLLRPDGLPLGRMRRLLGGAAIAAAFLRTIDGAQWMVVARRMGIAMAEAMSTLPEFKEPEMAAQVKATVPLLMSGSTVLQTAFVAGTFALLGQYFRSERVRQAVSAQDGHLAEEED
ncbi:hypothetical protein JRI60_17880 [Archangium violaceum]|uniref:hypothetical protein n=1 Tax=Archangium violaceum TaxID=83451 RepID=UPI00194DC0CC|nr:hypothetical protein [Archangium violaceum]QRO00763.1 hypothetical protein JRI60_17880 [Archangium violaceum]